jgi:hypothetical protein
VGVRVKHGVRQNHRRFLFFCSETVRTYLNIDKPFGTMAETHHQSI